MEGTIFLFPAGLTGQVTNHRFCPRWTVSDVHGENRDVNSLDLDHVGAQSCLCRHPILHLVKCCHTKSPMSKFQYFIKPVNRSMAIPSGSSLTEADIRILIYVLKYSCLGVNIGDI